MAGASGLQSNSAIPIRNEKGEISMRKVKVQRYISGKRPEYAQRDASSGESSAEEDFIEQKRGIVIKDIQLEQKTHEDVDEDVDDPRLRRLRAVKTTDRDYSERHRHIHEPEKVSDSSSDSEESEDDREIKEVKVQYDNHQKTRRISICSESDSGDEDLSDSEIEKRRQYLRQKMLQQKREEEVLQKEEERQSEPSDSESSEYEEETESEEENEPRLKPLFVRKRDRTTVIEKERDLMKQKQAEYEAKKAAKERRRQTLRLVEESVKKDLEAQKAEKNPNINDVCTDDENDELEYEAWKLRELKRIKRDREEREQLEREKNEIERVRNMTEEERRQEFRLNPKHVLNKAVKGKYKFLQKYYHRGAFYLDKDETIFKQDFSAPTLEDHFDKTILPKVMQVKNFGRCGRTKYTHLVDQDTTQFDSPWVSDTANNVKFHQEKAGGMKQVFDRPSLYKRKKD